MDQIDIIDDKYVLKEKLVFQVGEVKEKITCTCVSFNETNSEELVIFMHLRYPYLNLLQFELL